MIVSIVVAQRAGHLVSAVAKGSIPNDAIGILLSFNMVRFLPLILSLAIFLGVLLTLTRWHRDSEMAIWFSSGLGLNSWIKPVLSVAVPIVLIILMLSLMVMPWAYKKADDYKAQLKNRDELSTISPGVFKESRGGERVYFVEGLDSLGFEVKNVFIQSKQHEKNGIIVANRGKREKEENGDSFLVLEQGRRYQRVPNSAEVSTTEFERYSVRIETKEAAPKTNRTDGKPTSKLLKDNTSADKAEFQWRLAIPISALILVLMAIPLSFVDPRAGRSLNVMFAVFIFIIYNNVLSIFQAWITQNRISHIIGLWPVHILFLLLTAYMFYRRNHLLPLLPQLFKRK